MWVLRCVGVALCGCCSVAVNTSVNSEMQDRGMQGRATVRVPTHHAIASCAGVASIFSAIFMMPSILVTKVSQLKVAPLIYLPPNRTPHHSEIGHSTEDFPRASPHTTSKPIARKFVFLTATHEINSEAYGLRTVTHTKAMARHTVRSAREMAAAHAPSIAKDRNGTVPQYGERLCTCTYLYAGSIHQLGLLLST